MWETSHFLLSFIFCLRFVFSLCFIIRFSQSWLNLDFFPRSLLCSSHSFISFDVCYRECAKRVAEVSVDARLPLNQQEYVDSFKPHLMDVVFAWTQVSHSLIALIVYVIFVVLLLCFCSCSSILLLLRLSFSVLSVSALHLVSCRPFVVRVPNLPMFVRWPRSLKAILFAVCGSWMSFLASWRRSAKWWETAHWSSALWMEGERWNETSCLLPRSICDLISRLSHHHAFLKLAVIKPLRSIDSGRITTRVTRFSNICSFLRSKRIKQYMSLSVQNCLHVNFLSIWSCKRQNRGFCVSNCCS